CCLEHPRRRRKTVGRHAFTADVEDRERRNVESIVIGRADMADKMHVSGHWLVVPARTAKEERLLRSRMRGTKEELFDTSLTVGQAVAKEREVRVEARDRRHRMV